MKIIKRTWKYAAVLSMVLLWVSTMTVFAEGDNSLAALGVENGEVSPEFYYSTTEYDVTVPAGTKELILEPQTSDSNASIQAIDGTQLDNGTGTVTISVEADNGSVAVYTLHVSPGEGAAVTEAATETTQVTETTAPETVKTQQTEPAVDAAATQLRTQVTQLEGKIDLFMKIMYGMIALAVILLFIIINLLLKVRDLKEDLKNSQNALDLSTNEFARKEKNMSSDYYYAPVQEMEQESAGVREDSNEKVQKDTEETFGNGEVTITADAISKEIKPMNQKNVSQIPPQERQGNARKNKSQRENQQRPVNQQPKQRNDQAEGGAKSGQNRPVNQNARPKKKSAGSQPKNDGSKQPSRGQNQGKATREASKVDVTMIDL